MALDDDVLAHKREEPVHVEARWDGRDLCVAALEQRLKEAFHLLVEVVVL